MSVRNEEQAKKARLSFSAILFRIFRIPFNPDTAQFCNEPALTLSRMNGMPSIVLFKLIGDSVSLNN